MLKQRLDHYSLTLFIYEIKELFLYNGFLESPLSNKKIVKYIFRGFNKHQIYNIGCEYNNGFHKYRKKDFQKIMDRNYVALV